MAQPAEQPLAGIKAVIAKASFAAEAAAVLAAVPEHSAASFAASFAAVLGGIFGGVFGRHRAIRAKCIGRGHHARRHHASGHHRSWKLTAGSSRKQTGHGAGHRRRNVTDGPDTAWHHSRRWG